MHPKCSPLAGLPVGCTAENRVPLAWEELTQCILKQSSPYSSCNPHLPCKLPQTRWGAGTKSYQPNPPCRVRTAENAGVARVQPGYSLQNGICPQRASQDIAVYLEWVTEKEFDLHSLCYISIADEHQSGEKTNITRNDVRKKKRMISNCCLFTEMQTGQ